MSTKLLVVMGVIGAGLVGCASNAPPPVGPPIAQIYDQVNRQGAQDAVDILRQGLRSKHVYGQSDPYIPLRQPEIVIPIWVPPYVDPTTGDRVDGHWEHAVIQNSQWELGDGDGGN